MSHRADRIDFDDFSSRTDFGSVCDPEQTGYRHVIDDLGGAGEAAKGEARSRIDGDIGLDSADSADQVFDRGWVSPDNHFGLEVDGIQADNPDAARQQVVETLGDMGFESDGRKGFSGGGDQFWRDSPDGGSQEHLRFYGVTEQPDGSYKAIFVGEGDRLPDSPDRSDAVRTEQGFKDAQPLTEGPMGGEKGFGNVEPVAEGPMRGEQGFAGVEPLAEGKTGDSRADMPDLPQPDSPRDAGDGGHHFTG